MWLDLFFELGNEQTIGEVLSSTSVPRSSLYIQSKLAPANVSTAEVAIQAVKDSIEKLQCHYLDSYLIHWPVSHIVNCMLNSNSLVDNAHFLVNFVAEFLISFVGSSWFIIG